MGMSNQFLQYGKSLFANCKYSHHPSDIKVYLELEKRKDFLGGAFKKTWEKGKTSANNNNYKQAAVGAKGTSPGVKPKYKPILREPGTVTCKTS